MLYETNIQKLIRVDSTLYGNVILIVILASNVCSSHGQNANLQNEDTAEYVNAGGGSDDGDGDGGGGGGDGGGSDNTGSGDNSSRHRVQNSGEVMASRLPVLNVNEPSCEELKAMWRYEQNTMLIHSHSLVNIPLCIVASTKFPFSVM